MTYVDATIAPPRNTGQIKLYKPEDFEGMRSGGRLAAACLDMPAGEVGARRRHRAPRPPSPASSRWTTAPPRRFVLSRLPQSLHSLNHVVCHGIPNDKPLREGDIVNID